MNFINRYPVLLGVSLLVFSTLFCWIIYNKFGSTNIYYLSIGIYLICAFLFLVGASRYKDHKVWSIILLSGASFLLVLSLFDFYLVTFRYDTSGPGGKNVITHRNWFNTFVSKNEYGFWERGLAEFNNPLQRNNQLVIAVVGDSFTWGQGVEGKKSRFTERLEKKLNSTSGREEVTVLNFGQGGADTLKEINIVQEYVAKVHPDIVLICYLTNDINVNNRLSDRKYYDTTGEKLSTLNPTLNFIYWRLIGPMKYKNFGLAYMNNLVEAYKAPETFNNHIKDIYKLIEEVRKIGARPIFVLMPFPQMWNLFPKSMRDNIYENIRNLLLLKKVPVIDLTYIEEKYSPDEFVVNSFDAHPNAKMHEEFAEAIYNWFMNHKDYLKPPRTSKHEWDKLPG